MQESAGWEAEEGEGGRDELIGIYQDGKYSFVIESESRRFNL